MFGSPRQGGNTDILLKEFVRGCEEAGADVETIRLANLDVTGCMACGGCEAEGHCVIDDDMHEVYTAVDRCNLVVIASPVFFYNAPAQAKAVIDRSQAQWSRKYILKKDRPPGGPARKGFFIGVGATKGKRLFEGICLTMRYFFDAIDVSYEGDLLFRDMDAAGDIRNHPTALQEAYDAGVKFASS